MRLFLVVALVALPLSGAAPLPDSLGLAPSLLSSFGSVCLAAQDDADSGRDASYEAPVALAAGTYAGCVDGRDHGDVYESPVARGDRIEVTAEPTDCDQAQQGNVLAYISIRSAANASQEDGYDAEAFEEPCRAVRVASTAPFDGVVRLRISTYAGGGAYAFTLRVGALPAFCNPLDDAGSGRDASLAEPVPVAPGSFSGCVDRFDEYDRYAVPVAAGQLLYARLVPTTCELALFGRYWDDRAQGVNWGCEEQELGRTIEADGTFPVTVYRRRTEETYALEVRVAASFPRHCALQDDAGSGGDSLGGPSWNFYVRSHDESTPLPDGASAGCIDLFDGWDEYRVDVAHDEVIRVVARATNCDASFSVPQTSNYATTSTRVADDPAGCATRTWGLHGEGRLAFATDRWTGGDTGFEFLVERCGTREPVPWDARHWSRLALDGCPPEGPGLPP